jgi:hypothetical protein
LALGFVFIGKKGSPANKPTARSLDGGLEVAVGTCHSDVKNLTPERECCQKLFSNTLGPRGPLLFFCCGKNYFFATE